MTGEVLEKTETRTLIGEVRTTTTPHDATMLAWRELAFLDMGFASHEATALSRTCIDLHEMRKLLTSGCPHELAWQILLGTCFAGEDEFAYALLSESGDEDEDEDDGA